MDITNFNDIKILLDIYVEVIHGFSSIGFVDKCNHVSARSDLFNDGNYRMLRFGPTVVVVQQEVFSRWISGSYIGLSLRIVLLEKAANELGR